jgi:hypothetical protein
MSYLLVDAVRIGDLAGVASCEAQMRSSDRRVEAEENFVDYDMESKRLT